MSTSPPNSYLGERLFHFWSDKDRDTAFAIFASIVERGLLLSRGNRGLIDWFPYRRGDGNIAHKAIIQNARVCFTDIPEDKLQSHCTRYGRCGLGFSRRTILSWGGVPVWYCPNHIETGTLQDHGSAHLYGFGEAVQILAVVPDLLKQSGIPMTQGDQNLSYEQATVVIDRAVHSLIRIGSFFKEMSTKEADDHRYLYEREWRIVRGVSSRSTGDPFRKLTAAEKEELTKAVPEWGKPMQSDDPRLNSNLPKDSPLIDSFWFFKGIPGRQTVSQMVEVITVPDASFGHRVSNYIADNPARFSPRGPEIRVLN